MTEQPISDCQQRFSALFASRLRMGNAVDGCKVGLYFTRPFEFQSSSMVEHAAVNRVVVGSSPTSGAIFGNRWFSIPLSQKR